MTEITITATTAGEYTTINRVVSDLGLGRSVRKSGSEWYEYTFVVWGPTEDVERVANEV